MCMIMIVIVFHLIPPLLMMKNIFYNLNFCFITIELKIKISINVLLLEKNHTNL